MASSISNPSARPLDLQASRLDLKAPRNLLLSCLPAGEYQRLATQLRPITLPQGLTLYEPQRPVERVYFPESGMVSMVMEAATTDKSLEVGILGREGMLGLHTAQDTHGSFTRAVMQIAGKGWWLPRETFAAEFQRGGSLTTLALQHLQMMLSQTAQSAFCCSVHAGTPRLCRWLLQTRLWTGLNAFNLTHEFLAQMLGTQRASVTLTLRQIESMGAIATQRGCIEIIDAAALEAQSCGCYKVLVRRYHDLVEGYQKAA